MIRIMLVFNDIRLKRLRGNAFLVRRTQTARPFRVIWLDRSSAAREKIFYIYMDRLLRIPH